LKLVLNDVVQQRRMALAVLKSRMGRKLLKLGRNNVFGSSVQYAITGVDVGCHGWCDADS
jgi:hypothetical protein